MVLSLDNITEAMRNGSRLSFIGPDQLKTGMEAIMRDVFILAGYEPQLIYEQLDDLSKDIQSSFPTLTLAELRLAAKAGVAGELGGPKKPSYASMMQWVDAYNRSAMVADARKIRATRQAEPERISDEEGWRIFTELMPQSLRRRWDDIRTQGRFGKATIPHVSAQIYDWLGEEGVLRLTDEQRNIASQKGRKEVQSDSVWDLNDLESGKALIRSRVKHYALEIWMQDLFNKGGKLTVPTKIARFY